MASLVPGPNPDGLARLAELETLLADERRARHRAESGLAEALEHQGATAKILQAISQSPNNLQSVLDSIADSAARLCGTDRALIFLVDGDRLAPVAGITRDGERRSLLEGGAPLDRHDSPPHRAIVDRAIVHVHDLQTVPIEDMRADIPRRMGMRTLLAVPLLREDQAIGAINLGHTEFRPFTDHQIALVRTFADQAVIATQNARLISELQDRTTSLEAALEQQTATADVLATIIRSPKDLEGVLDTIATTAARLIDAPNARVFRLEGDHLRVVGASGEFARLLKERQPTIPATRERVAGRAVVERRTIHVPDSATFRAQFPEAFAAQVRDTGVQPDASITFAALAVPLLREGEPIGALMMGRPGPPLTDNLIRLVETFADQAVIAIENARLFSELSESNTSLREALEQQTATAEVLEVISRSPTDLQTVLDTIASSASRLCGTGDAGIFRRQGTAIRVAAWHGGGDIGVPPSGEDLPLDRGSASGRAILERRTIHLPDIEDIDPSDFPITHSQYRRFGNHAVLVAPLQRAGEAIGALIVRRLAPGPFSEGQVALLETFADQAVIAIENTRLFGELQERLHEQTATSEVLRVISRSPTDLSSVFNAICQSAGVLCGAAGALIQRTDGRVKWLAGHWEREESGLGEYWGTLIPSDPETGSPSTYRGPLPRSVESPGSVANEVIRSMQTRHIVDLWGPEGDAYAADTQAFARKAGVRTHLSIPLLRGDGVLGVLNLYVTEVRPFTDQQIRLMESFADQAVIAIENSRLFQELQERTDQLTRSVDRLTALFEVGQAVGSTLDLDRVLETVVARAAELAGADGGAVYEFDGESRTFDFRATYRMSEEMVATIRETHIPLNTENVVGAAALARAPVQVADILAEEADSITRRVLEREGYRAVLSVPLLRDDQIIGGLVVRRRAAGVFDPDTVALLQTFATQSALAIQNARLFQELAEKSRQLEVASRHKSEFLANMSHELRTPLNAIIGFTEVLLERYFGEINDKQEEYLRDVLSSGQHLLALINDILDLSKVEAGRMELDLATFDLGHALEAGLVMVKERASKKGIDLTLDLSEDVGRLEADERKVKQVLFNLLTNAVKFTPEGGAIAVMARRDNDRVEVAVRDTGVGIAPEDQARIFEEFGQARNQHGQTEGTGLGLALVKSYVELHGGTIRLDSGVGHGSTFTFTLPVHRTAPA